MDISDYSSKYQGNPDGSEMNFDVADVDIEYTVPRSSKIKRFWRKIERMFDYPVGLTNLRDPDYLMPNNSIVASNSRMMLTRKKSPHHTKTGY